MKTNSTFTITTGRDERGRFETRIEIFRVGRGSNQRLAHRLTNKDCLAIVNHLISTGRVKFAVAGQ